MPQRGFPRLDIGIMFPLDVAAGEISDNQQPNRLQVHQQQDDGEPIVVIRHRRLLFQNHSRTVGKDFGSPCRYGCSGKTHIYHGIGPGLTRLFDHTGNRFITGFV